MTPKPKKLPTWFLCENCEANISYKESKSHSTQCPSSPELWTTPFVLNGILHTVLNTAEMEEKSNMSKEYGSKLIFISEHAMQLCKIATGDPVEIRCADNNAFVKFAWPEKHITPTFASIPRNLVDSSWSINEDIKISIKPLNVEPTCIESIGVEFSKGIKLVNKSEFIKFIKSHFVDKIVSIFNTLSVCYYGTIINLNIINISANSTSYTKDYKENHWFVISKYTNWIFRNDDIDEKKSEKMCIGGVDSIINNVLSMVDIALKSTNLNSSVNLIKCIILYGPSGTGKTLICKYIAAQSQAHVINLCGSQIYSKYFGETEAAIKKAFSDAIKNSPCIILIDEIDTLCPKQTSNTTEQEKRIISALATLLDDLHVSQNKIFILSNTNKLDMVDSSLRRYGRIDYEIEVPVPDKNSRLDIFEKLLENFPHSISKKEVIEITDSAHGFVGADIANLFTQATMHAVKNNQNVDKLVFQFSDFQWALQQIKPSAMREVLLDIPNVKWSDIGGQNDLKLKLKQSIEWPLKHEKSFSRLGIKPPSGVLMYGPPGCSKTMIAKALANESGLNFLSIKGPELFSKWVGESERAVRDLFRKARQVAPSIIFFDEIDAISGERYKNSGNSNVQERVLAQILTELDGISPLGNVTIVAATNRPDKIDSALLRPGRLDRIVYVSLPDRETRASIFKIKLSKMSLNNDVSVDYLIDNTENYSGAEVQAVCHEAALKALEEDINCSEIFLKHFETALQIIKPRTPSNLISIYEKFGESYMK